MSNKSKVQVECCFNCSHCYHWPEHGVTGSYHCDEDCPFEIPHDDSVEEYSRVTEWRFVNETQPDFVCDRYHG